jgi:hypothetical protein
MPAIVPPLPPRRSEDLPIASIPLPPARPVQLASVIAQPVPRAVAAYAANTPAFDGSAAIRSLVEAAQGTREPHKPALPNVITEGTSTPDKSPQQTALAYAPAGGATPGLRAVALGRPYLSREAIGRKVDFVAARLDRSNFRALIGSAPAVRMTTQTVLGPALAAPRAASRADFDLFAAAPAAGYVTGFGRIATDLPVNSFVPPALNLARAAIN